MFDVQDERFIYRSADDLELEREILNLKKSEDIDSLLGESADNFCKISCDHLQRVLMIRRMASHLFFGMCVDRTPEIMAMAEKAMKGNLN